MRQQGVPPNWMPYVESSNVDETVRLATTLVGLLAVVFVWLLGREMYGRDVGLLAAGFLAVSRWHVDFSRFGMAIVFPTLFIPATLYFWVRSQRRLSANHQV